MIRANLRLALGLLWLAIGLACSAPVGADGADSAEPASGGEAVLEVVLSEPLPVVAEEPEQRFTLYRAEVGSSVALRVFLRATDGKRREITNHEATLFEAITENLAVDEGGHVRFLRSGDPLTRIGQVGIAHGAHSLIISFDILEATEEAP